MIHRPLKVFVISRLKINVLKVIGHKIETRGETKTPRFLS
jgi:hypothetical protein